MTRTCAIRCALCSNPRASHVRDFDSAKAVLADDALAKGACLIADIRMPDMDGLALQEELVKRRVGLPVIIVTGHGDVPLAVRAMRAGAVDFIEKPFDDELLLQSIKRALARGQGKPRSGVAGADGGGAHRAVDRARTASAGAPCGRSARTRSSPTSSISRRAPWKSIAHTSWRKCRREACRTWSAWRLPPA